MSTRYRYWSLWWRSWVGIDNGSAISHFCLEAAELGLGTCIMGSFDEAQVKDILKIPAEKTVKIVIALGYAADETIRPKLRRPLEQVASFGQYE